MFKGVLTEQKEMFKGVLTEQFGAKKEPKEPSKEVVQPVLSSSSTSPDAPSGEDKKEEGNMSDYKLCLLGSQHGKSAYLTRFLDGSFDPDESNTVGTVE
jgi:hypothetical protein